MKKIVSFDKAIGGDGLKAEGLLGVEGSDLVAEVKAAFPLAKVVEPAGKVIDDLVDKVEKLIPGDQKALAEKLKAEAREQLVKLLSEKSA